MKGVIFYDGGGSFDAPYLNHVERAAVTNNNFDVNKREDMYIQPVLVWNKNILTNNLKNKIIDIFIEINKYNEMNMMRLFMIK